MTKKAIHVVPKDGKWATRKEGSTRASSVHSTKQEALDSARKTAKRHHVEVYIHGRDGKIRDLETPSRTVHLAPHSGKLSPSSINRAVRTAKRKG